MALINRNYVNPMNEALRKDIEGPPDVEEMVAALVEKTSRIHAGYLFVGFGRDALTKLCLCLSGTKSSLYYKGWEDFAIGLGLDHLQVKCIDYSLNLQDPATYTLLAFVQKRDSTVDKIITTLKNIKRFDIINIMCDDFYRLAEDVLRSQSNRGEEDSGFSSIQSDSDYESVENSSDHNTIFRPAFVPPVPLVLQEKRSALEITAIESESANSRIVNERYRTRSSVDMGRSDGAANKYRKTVMLTFATDGLDLAKEVADIFRREKESEQRIGVVILNEHAGLVNTNPQEFIFSCFDQVDYVVPIITEGYLKAVSALNSEVCESSLQCIDPKYVKYVYTLMNTNYLQKNCLNDKVRCLIPDSLTHMTHQKGLFRGPLFQAWYKLSDLAELKQRMLGSSI